MAYQMIETVENRTGTSYSSWEDFQHVYYAGGDFAFWAEQWQIAGRAAGKGTDELGTLLEYALEPVFTTTWNNDTQTATKTHTIPTKAIFDLMEELRVPVTASFNDGLCLRTLVSHGEV
mgnify:FL=1|tara:strand:+ start:7330 stop:7686 length:357 start_codon:yes stop_codon:yes gene_type:complete